jgi:hypothetical protein
MTNEERKRKRTELMMDFRKVEVGVKWHSTYIGAFL